MSKAIWDTDSILMAIVFSIVFLWVLQMGVKLYLFYKETKKQSIMSDKIKEIDKFIDGLTIEGHQKYQLKELVKQKDAHIEELHRLGEQIRKFEFETRDERNELKFENEEMQERINHLEKGIKWAMRNPQSVFLFDELKKTLNHPNN